MNNTCEDEQLVERYNKGYQEAFNVLLERYTDRINYLARRYFNSKGLTLQDYFQEGAVGLFNAVKKYNADHNTSFYYFASLQIRSQMINAIKMANRKKHFLLNEALSFDVQYNREENCDRLWIESIRHTEPSPEEYYFLQFEQQQFNKKLHTFFYETLSPLEREVLLSLCKGHSYQVTAKQLDIGSKSVDNALCRVKSKFANRTAIE